MNRNKGWVRVCAYACVFADVVCARACLCVVFVCVCVRSLTQVKFRGMFHKIEALHYDIIS